MYDRPQTRGDCAEGLRPCPFIGCRYHLGLETKLGALRLTCETADDMEQMEETCALDVADRGANTLPEVASLLGVSRQRISQVEIAALQKLRKELLATAGQAIVDMMPGLFAGNDNDDAAVNGDEDVQSAPPFWVSHGGHS